MLHWIHVVFRFNVISFQFHIYTERIHILQLFNIVINFFLSFFHLICFRFFHINRAHVLLHINFLHKAISDYSIWAQYFLEGTHIHLTLWINIFFIVYHLFILFVKFLLLVGFKNNVHLAINLLVMYISIFFFIMLI